MDNEKLIGGRFINSNYNNKTMKKRGEGAQKKIIVTIAIILLLGISSITVYNSRYFAEKRGEAKEVEAGYQYCIETTEVENKEEYCKYSINLRFATMTQNKKYCDEMPLPELTEECLNEIEKIKRETPPFPY